MTSYGRLKDLQEIARVMIDALKYMLENTFEQRPQGGPELDFSGFPGWCMYVLAMYAQVRLHCCEFDQLRAPTEDHKTIEAAVFSTKQKLEQSQRQELWGDSYHS